LTVKLLSYSNFTLAGTFFEKKDPLKLVPQAMEKWANFSLFSCEHER